MDPLTLLVPILAALLGGGLLTAVVAFRRSKPEIEGLMLTNAKTESALQQGWIDGYRSRITELEAQLEAAHQRITELERELGRDPEP